MVEKILLKNIDVENQYRIDTYIKGGGYTALSKCLKMPPQDVTEEVKKSGLRGRGGAGFPTGLKWTFVPKDSPKPKYLCVNGDEGEPGTFKDRLLMERDPHLMLEGTIIASFTLNVHLAFIYVRGEFTLSIERLKAAITEAYAKGFLGRNIMGSGFDLDVILHSGAGAYICGEETALIESIEGKRGQPRQKPPFPAVVGLFKGPTVVNNVETLAAIPYIILNGSGAYRQHGTEKSPGTKLFSVSGDVNRPGVYEVDMGFPLRRFLDEFAGGTIDNKKIKAVIPGGSSTPVLTSEEVDKVNLDYESLQTVGSMLGSGGVIVISEGRCMVRCLSILSHFYADESCGKCTPCREGTGWMEKIIERIEEGKGEMGDIDLLLSLSKNMMGRTICPLSDAAAMPVMSFVNKFKVEFEEHIRDRRCPWSH